VFFFFFAETQEFYLLIEDQEEDHMNFSGGLAGTPNPQSVSMPKL